jgi:hypothetical protein
MVQPDPQSEGVSGAFEQVASDPAIETETADIEPLSFGRKTARVLAIGVMLCIAALWSYTLWGPTKKTPPGLLADASWAVQAQSICTDAAAEIDALPPAYTAADAPARADVIMTANASLRTMLRRLGAAAPEATASNDGRMIDEWLTDWQTYLGDRDRYVDALEADPTARFYVTEKVKGQQITKPIDFFAKYNDMPNCMTPGDLG